jgi:hypothetical protein
MKTITERGGHYKMAIGQYPLQKHVLSSQAIFSEYIF